MGPPLAARGIVFAGLDVIGDWLTEVNVTSPTCFREIQDQTGHDSGDEFIAAVEARVAR
ncbi:Glutathione synthetase [compost metagenome]